MHKCCKIPGWYLIDLILFVIDGVKPNVNRSGHWKSGVSSVLKEAYHDAIIPPRKKERIRQEMKDRCILGGSSGQKTLSGGFQAELSVTLTNSKYCRYQKGILEPQIWSQWLFKTIKMQLSMLTDIWELQDDILTVIFTGLKMTTYKKTSSVPSMFLAHFLHYDVLTAGL